LRILLVIAAVSIGLGPGLSHEACAKEERSVKCRIEFNLNSWSVFYKRSKGEGVITCDNGQRADVKISAHGGGVTFGKSEITKGHGTFSKVNDISQLYGGYATSEAHAGASKSSDAQAMTKGDISLAISGTGEGYDLGFAFGSFKIKPIKTKKEN
jgi:hypothetical protein